jgi:hypothetical protein
MTVRLAAPLVALLVFTANAGCRDAEGSPTRPSFDVTAADTLPGGCTDRVCNFRASGNAAFISWSTALGSVASDTGGGGGGGTIQFGSASVSRGGDRANQQTFLFYSVVECSPFFCSQIAGGFGQIPSGDFETQGTHYRLSTNTASNPGFFTFAGSPGVITIEWAPNGLFSQSFNGVRRFTQPGFSEQQSGQSTDQSATAIGNVVGFTIGSGNSGSISNSRDVRITITR